MLVSVAEMRRGKWVAGALIWAVMANVLATVCNLAGASRHEMFFEGSPPSPRTNSSGPPPPPRHLIPTLPLPPPSLLSSPPPSLLTSPPPSLLSSPPLAVPVPNHTESFRNPYPPHRVRYHHEVPPPPAVDKFPPPPAADKFPPPSPPAVDKLPPPPAADKFPPPSPPAADKFPPPSPPAVDKFPPPPQPLSRSPHPPPPPVVIVHHEPPLPPPPPVLPRQEIFHQPPPPMGHSSQQVGEYLDGDGIRNSLQHGRSLMPLLRKQHSHQEESHTHRTPLTVMPTLSGRRRLSSKEEGHVAAHLPDFSLEQEHFEMEHFPLQGGGSLSSSLGGKCADPVLAPSYIPQGGGGGGYGGYVPVGSPLLPPGVPSLAPAPPLTSGSDDPYNNPLPPPQQPSPSPSLSPAASSNSTRAHTTVVSAMKYNQCTYTIITSTGNIEGAGTTADVNVEFFDKFGNSVLFVNLKSQNRNFERGATDTFTVVGDCVRSICRMHLSHDDAGPDPSWFVNTVTVSLMYQTHVFNVFEWLSKTEPPYALSHTVTSCPAL